MDDRKELTATRWVTNRLWWFTLSVLAFYFVLGPNAPGFEWIAKKLGSESHVYGIGLAIVFVVLVGMSQENAKLRVRLAETNAETTEALHQLLYGKDYRRDREAIEILITTLESQTGENAKVAHGHLCRLTGQAFAADPKVWRSWWEANKKTFERAR